MKVLAIDPGSEQSAIVAWDGTSISNAVVLPNEQVRNFLKFHSAEYQLIVIEMIGHYGKGMPAGKTVFNTCIWIGRYIERCALEPKLIMRGDVKLHLCGSVRGKDQNVKQALVDRFGAPGTSKNPGLTFPLRGEGGHKWQAFALAVYAFDIYGNQQTRSAAE